MGPPRQQSKHSLRIVRVDRLAEHLIAYYDDRVGRKDGSPPGNSGDGSCFLKREATGVGPRVFPGSQGLVDVCRTDLEWNSRCRQQLGPPG